MRLTTTAPDKSGLTLGASRLGGRPDVPKDFVWPRWEGTPADQPDEYHRGKLIPRDPPSLLSFLAQIDLSEVPALGDPLPRRGYLYFFFVARQAGGGYKPHSWHAWRVLYFDVPRSSLSPASPPRGKLSCRKWAPLALEMSPMATLPSRLGQKLGEAESHDYEALRSKLQGSGQHQLLGWSTPYQDCPERYAETFVQLADVPIAWEAWRWRLLLQLGDDERIREAGSSYDHAWSDVVRGGAMYFVARQQDLLNNRLDRVVGCVQT
jgi:uncharacterized protein YwqG